MGHTVRVLYHKLLLGLWAREAYHGIIMTLLVSWRHQWKDQADVDGIHYRSLVKISHTHESHTA